MQNQDNIPTIRNLSYSNTLRFKMAVIAMISLSEQEVPAKFICKTISIIEKGL